MSGPALAGLGVLVTRPARQAEGLCQLISAHGGLPVRFPAMAILPPVDPAPARELLSQDWDIAIYISANAVRGTLDLGGLPRARRTAAVGAGTAQTLAAAGRSPDWIPMQADSEGLLALPVLAQPCGQRVLIVRGAGGRALLGDSLQQRGAQVAYADVYHRCIPNVDPVPLLAQWAETIQVVTATSGELLDNLARLLGDAGRLLLCTTPLVVISERMEHTARALGITRVLRATGAEDGAILTALKTLAQEHCP